MFVERSIVIATPVTLVWSVMVDVERWPAWMPTIQEVQPLSTDGLAVGSRYALKQPLQKRAVWTVVSCEPERVFQWERHRDDQLMFLGIHEIEPVGEATRARVVLRADGQLVSLLRPIFAAVVTEECRALKRECERIHCASSASDRVASRHL